MAELRQSPYTSASLRMPPQNIEAEQALLGSIMIRPGGLHEILDIIRPESFYSDRHRIIYTVMLELFSKNNPIDFLSLSSRLKERGELEQAGGVSYLTELANAVPSSSNIEYYGDII